MLSGIEDVSCISHRRWWEGTSGTSYPEFPGNCLQGSFYNPRKMLILTGEISLITVLHASVRAKIASSELQGAQIVQGNCNRSYVKTVAHMHFLLNMQLHHSTTIGFLKFVLHKSISVVVGNSYNSLDLRHFVLNRYSEWLRPKERSSWRCLIRADPISSSRRITSQSEQFNMPRNCWIWLVPWLWDQRGWIGCISTHPSLMTKLLQPVKLNGLPGLDFLHRRYSIKCRVHLFIISNIAPA